MSTAKLFLAYKLQFFHYLTHSLRRSLSNRSQTIEWNGFYMIGSPIMKKLS